MLGQQSKDHADNLGKGSRFAKNFNLVGSFKLVRLLERQIGQLFLPTLFLNDLFLKLTSKCPCVFFAFDEDIVHPFPSKKIILGE